MTGCVTCWSVNAYHKRLSTLVFSYTSFLPFPRLSKTSEITASRRTLKDPRVSHGRVWKGYVSSPVVEHWILLEFSV